MDGFIANLGVSHTHSLRRQRRAEFLKAGETYPPRKCRPTISSTVALLPAERPRKGRAGIRPLREPGEICQGFGNGGNECVTLPLMDKSFSPAAYFPWSVWGRVHRLALLAGARAMFRLAPRPYLVADGGFADDFRELAQDSRRVTSGLSAALARESAN